MKKILTALLAVLPITLFAQHLPTETRFTIPLGGMVDVQDQPDDWHISLQHLEAPGPGTASFRTELREKKQHVQNRFPRRQGQSVHRAGGGVPLPTVGVGFEANVSSSTPNDNDVAMADTNVISVINSNIRFLTTEGELHDIMSLSNLASPLGLQSSKFDPKVVYDPNADRYVMVFLNGSAHQTSMIVVAFSRTSDPLGVWNVYALPGNPLDNDTWSDYPVIGISQDELFIGINTYLNGSTNNSGFVETCLWQIGLQAGYDSTALETAYYSDILDGDKEIFNICPIQGGVEPHGPDQYLLASWSFDEENDTLFLLHVTGNLDDPSRELTVEVLHTPETYYMPVPAKQPNGHWFDTNDNRVLGGFYMNNRIQWVQATTDTSLGRPGFLHGIIEDVTGNPTVSTTMISDPILDYGYPNISSMAPVGIDQQALISFNHTADTVFPGMSCIYYSTAGEYTERIHLKSGTHFVNVLSDSLERWGDYSGTQLEYFEDGTVWVAGSFGRPGNAHGTWIQQLTSPDQSLRVEEVTHEDRSIVFPNPVLDLFNFEFELKETALYRLELFDVNGRLVKPLLFDKVKAGRNQLSFNLNQLTAGTYFLKGVSEAGESHEFTLIKD